MLPRELVFTGFPEMPPVLVFSQTFSSLRADCLAQQGLQWLNGHPVPTLGPAPR